VFVFEVNHVGFIKFNSNQIKQYFRYKA